MVGRLSRASLHICKKDNAAALALLTLVPRQLGTLGLLRGLGSIAEALSKVDAQVNKVGYYVISTKGACLLCPANAVTHALALYFTCISTGWLLVAGWQAKAQPIHAKCWLQAAVALMSSSEAAANSLVSYASDSCTDHAWANLAEVRTKLLLDQAAATQKMKVPQATCVSLQAAGCFQAGLMSQVTSVLFDTCSYSIRTH